MADGEADHVSLDLFKRAKVTVGGVEDYAYAFLMRSRRSGGAFTQQIGKLRKIIGSQGVAIAKYGDEQLFGKRLGRRTS